MQAAETPLFPLSSVLFPGGSLRLRIFETRYLDMIGRCLKADAEFGVVAIRRGSEVGAADFYSVGTLARTIDWYDAGPGILGIGAIGTRRFRVVEARRQNDGLYTAETRTPSGHEAEISPDQLAWGRELLDRLLDRAPHRYEPAERNLRDPDWVSWRLAELLPLPLVTRQELLESGNAAKRLARLAEIVEELGHGEQ